MTERIVVSYSVSDGCTYSCSVVVPLLVESRAAFIDELETHACEYLLATPEERWRAATTQFYGMDITDFMEGGEFYMPTVQSVDEWFVGAACRK